VEFVFASKQTLNIEAQKVRSSGVSHRHILIPEMARHSSKSNWNQETFNCISEEMVLSDYSNQKNGYIPIESPCNGEITVPDQEEYKNFRELLEAG
jgi:hypothetical protein